MTGNHADANTKSVKQISLEEIYKIEPHYNKKNNK